MCNFKTSNRMVHDVVEEEEEGEEEEEDNGDTTVLRRILLRDARKLLEEESNFMSRGSGWTLETPYAITVRVSQFKYRQPSGECYVDLPKKLKSRKATLNIRNTDNKCFMYCLMARHIPNVTHSTILNENSLTFNRHNYNFDGLPTPVSISDIRKFERLNPQTSVNVYECDSAGEITPLRVVSQERADHCNLLLYRHESGKSHYILILDFVKLIRPQLTSDRHKITVCNRCFSFREVRMCQPSAQAWLDEHVLYCKQHKPTPISLPTEETSSLSFQDHYKQIPLPIIIFADFEAYLQPTPSTNNIQEFHEPNSFCTLIKSTLPESVLSEVGLSSSPHFCRSDEAGKEFLLHIEDTVRRIETLYSRNVPCHMNPDESERHAQATACDLCKHPFSEHDIAFRKCADHNHITGEFRYSLCSACNTKAKTPSYIPCYFHNLSYDQSFIVRNLGVLQNIRVSAIPANSEKLISISVQFNKLKIRFLDSYRLMPQSLASLAQILTPADLIESSKLVPRDKLHLITRKGAYPYNYVCDSSVFDEPHLPPRKAFYNKLNEEELSQTDYDHAKDVWRSLHMTTFLDYHKFYLLLDTTLLCDVLSRFRAKCLESYSIDCCQEFTCPGLSFSAMLRHTKINLELITDPDQLLFVESAIRGGLTQVSLRHMKANNPLLEKPTDYDPNEDTSYILYLDCVNLYGWAMTQYLPYGNFKWVEPDSLNWYSLPDDSPTGCILECDVEVPDNVHDRMQDLPILPEVLVPPNGSCKKLLATLRDKTRYVAHYRVFKQCVHLGLKITKVHKILSFSQSPWMSKYIQFNATLRAQSTDKFDKDFYKLMNNACFGKTMENVRNRVDVKIVTSDSALQKLVRKARFVERRIISDNVVLVLMKRRRVLMNKPIYVGMSVLDISKVHMFSFHYDIMQAHFKAPDCLLILAYIDTDGILYFVKTRRDLYEILKQPSLSCHLDLSVYPTDHPLYSDKNKGQLGTFKDECGGRALFEYCGLRPKEYATCFNSDHTDASTLKAKGLKSQFVAQHLRFQDYKDVLFNLEPTTDRLAKAEFNLIRSRLFKLTTDRVKKKSLCAEDDKRQILPCGIRTLPYGHYKLRQAEEDGSSSDQS